MLPRASGLAFPAIDPPLVVRLLRISFLGRAKGNIPPLGGEFFIFIPAPDCAIRLPRRLPEDSP
jgi:hypothetical protein